MLRVLLDATDVDMVDKVKSELGDDFELLNRRFQNDLFGDVSLLKRYSPEDEMESQALPIDSTSSICFLDAPITRRSPCRRAARIRLWISRLRTILNRKMKKP